MARPLRIHMPGHVYHVFARGDNKMSILRDDDDFRQLLDVLTAALVRFTADCITYCLLHTHYHLLLIPREHTVSRVMHQVNTIYCQWFNRRHGRVGHVLQGRFGARVVGDYAYLQNALRYVAMNPVAAGCVKRPEDWEWSSYRANAGLCEPPPCLSLDPVWRAMRCADPESGRARYIAHIAGGETVEELERALLFGDDLLARRAQPLIEPHRDTRDFIYAERFVTRPPIEDVFQTVDSLPRLKQAAWEAFHRYAYTLQAISDVIGRSPSTISRWIHTIDADRGNGYRIGRSWHGKLRSGKFKI